MKSVDATLAPKLTAAETAAASRSQPADLERQRAAAQFEAIFLRKMLASLQKTACAKSGPNAGYLQMATDSLADVLSEHGGIGLQNQILQSLDAAEQKKK